MSDSKSAQQQQMTKILRKASSAAQSAGSPASAPAVIQSSGLSKSIDSIAQLKSADLGDLQRTYGNSFAQRAANPANMLSRMPDLGAFAKLGNMPSMPKMKTPPPMPSIPAGAANSMQKAITGGDASGGGGTVAPDVEQKIEGMRGGGRPLPTGLQGQLEGKLGADLGGVRLHTGGAAGGLAKSLGAEAFTTKSDIFFANNKFSPDSKQGQKLLAHEVTHVIQQGAAKPKKKSQHDPEETAPASTHEAAKSAGMSDEHANEAHEMVKKTKVHGMAQEMSGIPGAPTAPKAEHVEAATKGQPVATPAHTPSAPPKPTAPAAADSSKKAKGPEQEKADANKKAKEHATQQNNKQKAKETHKSAATQQAAKQKARQSKVPTVGGDSSKLKNEHYNPKNISFPEVGDATLPTWNQLVNGSISMSVAEVHKEKMWWGAITNESLGEFFGYGEAKSNQSAPTSTDLTGKNLSGFGVAMETVGKGLLTGVTDGVSSFATSMVTDGVLKFATMRIPYADGFMESAKLLSNPKKWDKVNFWDGGITDSFKSVGNAWSNLGHSGGVWIGIANFLELLSKILNVVTSITGAASKYLKILAAASWLLSFVPFIGVFFGWLAAFITEGILPILTQIDTVLGRIQKVITFLKFIVSLIIVWAGLGNPEELVRSQQMLLQTSQSYGSELASSGLDKLKGHGIKKFKERRVRARYKRAKKAVDELGKNEGQETSHKMLIAKQRLKRREDDYKKVYGMSPSEKANYKEEIAKEQTDAVKGTPDYQTKVQHRKEKLYKEKVEAYKKQIQISENTNKASSTPGLSKEQQKLVKEQHEKAIQKVFKRLAEREAPKQIESETRAAFHRSNSSWKGKTRKDYKKRLETKKKEKALADLRQKKAELETASHGYTINSEKTERNKLLSRTENHSKQVNKNIKDVDKKIEKAEEDLHTDEKSIWTKIRDTQKDNLPGLRFKRVFQKTFDAKPWKKLKERRQKLFAGTRWSKLKKQEQYLKHVGGELKPHLTKKHQDLIDKKLKFGIMRRGSFKNKLFSKKGFKERWRLYRNRTGFTSQIGWARNVKGKDLLKVFANIGFNFKVGWLLNVANFINSPISHIKYVPSKVALIIQENGVPSKRTFKETDYGLSFSNHKNNRTFNNKMFEVPGNVANPAFLGDSDKHPVKYNLKLPQVVSGVKPLYLTNVKVQTASLVKRSFRNASLDYLKDPKKTTDQAWVSKDQFSPTNGAMDIVTVNYSTSNNRTKTPISRKTAPGERAEGIVQRKESADSADPNLDDIVPTSDSAAGSSNSFQFPDTASTLGPADPFEAMDNDYMDPSDDAAFDETTFEDEAKPKPQNEQPHKQAASSTAFDAFGQAIGTQKTQHADHDAQQAATNEPDTVDNESTPVGPTHDQPDREALPPPPNEQIQDVTIASAQYDLLKGKEDSALIDIADLSARKKDAKAQQQELAGGRAVGEANLAAIDNRKQTIADKQKSQDKAKSKASEAQQHANQGGVEAKINQALMSVITPLISSVMGKAGKKTSVQGDPATADHMNSGGANIAHSATQTSDSIAGGSSAIETHKQQTNQVQTGTISAESQFKNKISNISSKEDDAVAVHDKLGEAIQQRQGDLSQIRAQQGSVKQRQVDDLQTADDWAAEHKAIRLAVYGDMELESM